MSQISLAINTFLATSKDIQHQILAAEPDTKLLPSSHSSVYLLFSLINVFEQSASLIRVCILFFSALTFRRISYSLPYNSTHYFQIFNFFWRLLKTIRVLPVSDKNPFPLDFTFSVGSCWCITLFCDILHLRFTTLYSVGQWLPSSILHYRLSREWSFLSVQHSASQTIPFDSWGFVIYPLS